MTDQANPLTSRLKSRWPRRVLIVFLILAGLYVAYRYTLHRMVEAKLDEIRKQGYPVTLAELNKWYPISFVLVPLLVCAGCAEISE